VLAATVAASLHSVLTTASALGLDRLTATSTESQLAESLLNKSGDKVGHFCFV
jgi:hypothetical protein